MFLLIDDVINNTKKYIAADKITSIYKIKTGETCIEYISGKCLTNRNPVSIITEINCILLRGIR